MGNTTLRDLSSDAESCDLRNNLISVTFPGNHLALLNGQGTVFLQNNWLETRFRHSQQKSPVQSQIEQGYQVTL